MPVPQIKMGRFSLRGDSHIFAPSIYPAEIVVSKERTKARNENLCEGETVDDTGSKNREILVTGKILRSELQAFDDLLDDGPEFDMLADEWVGEVEVLDGEYRGAGLDVYRFKLNLVSTGRDEGGYTGNGILSRGSAAPTEQTIDWRYFNSTDL
jgi:hypothetical protein